MKKLRTFCTVLLMVVFTISTVNSQNNFHNRHNLDPYNPEYVKGEVLIKFKDEAQVNITVTRGITKTGIESVDEVLEMYQAKAIDKVFKETREQRQLKSVRTIRDFKGKEIEIPTLFNIYKLKFDTIWDSKQLSEELEYDENIEFAEPNYLVYTMEILESGIIPDKPPKITPLPSNYSGNSDTYPNDPLYLDGSQWYLDAINAPAVWDLVTGDTTQIIGIIDTGVDWDHPDLDDNIWTNWDEIPENGIDDDNNGSVDDVRGWDFVNNDNNPNDDNSHGSHVAGIVAAEGNNGIGIIGVAFNSKVMCLKALQSNGTGSSSDLAEAVDYASENGAHVINLSLGSYANSMTVKSAIFDAYINGCYIVAAAGNDHKSIDPSSDPSIEYGVMYPASLSFVLGVQATKQNHDLEFGWKTSFSNYDNSGPFNSTVENYELSAPGNGIISLLPGGSYGVYSGTSMATPVVSGAIALLMEYFPNEIQHQMWLRLIFGQTGYLNVENSLNYVMPSSDIQFVSEELFDTGGDNDGKADAGEDVEMIYTVRNVGGLADSVWARVSFAPFEDSTKAVILKDSIWFGSIGPTVLMTSQDSIMINMSISLNNGTITRFMLNVYDGSALKLQKEIAITAEHGTTLQGIIDTVFYCTADRSWIIGPSIQIYGPNGKIIIEPGTRILSASFNTTNGGSVIANGTADSIIIIEGGSGHIDTMTYANYKGSGSNISYVNQCYLEGKSFTISKILNSYLYNNTSYSHCWLSYVNNCILINDGNGSAIFPSQIHNSYLENTKCNTNVSGSYNTLYKCKAGSYPQYPASITGSNNNLVYCNSFYSPLDKIGVGYNIILSNNVVFSPSGSHEYLTNQYWGTTDTTLIDDMIYDFWDNPYLAILHYQPIDTIPNEFAPGIVWRVLINDINPLDEYLEPLGAGVHCFEVYFSKAMDISYNPIITFGPTSPYHQYVVADSAHWSSDSSVYIAYREISINLFDGENTIQVSNARDTSGLPCPLENRRFKFVLQVAGSLNTEFNALPGIGMVELSWPKTDIVDILGYNIYRKYKIDSVSYSQVELINENLILDTAFIDHNVIPDTTYVYNYTSIATDMLESDKSKDAVAIPFNAANGDANGDLSVNVLDITTIVAYMLNQNPSPFLFDAADVNYDGQINVLDIIGLVQLISGDKSAPLTAFVDISDQKAFYEIIDNKLLLESEGNVAAMQFKFKVQGLKAKVKSVKILNELKIFSMAKGFEFAYGVVDDHIIGILFSFTGKEIPAGDQELFRFEGIDISEIEVSEIFGGDLIGNYVPILQKGQQVNLQTPDDYDLKVQPNPFTLSTTISWQLAEEAMVDISIYNLKGEKIKQIKNTYQPAGIYQQTWNATDNNGKKLTAGVYICHFEAKTENQKITKDVKIILMK